MIIDPSRVITVKDKALVAAGARAAILKAGCADRILAVLNERTLLNIQGALLAGEFSEAETATFRAGRAWVADTQAACRNAVTTGANPVWPKVPDGLRHWRRRFDTQAVTRGCSRAVQQTMKPPFKKLAYCRFRCSRLPNLVSRFEIVMRHQVLQ